MAAMELLAGWAVGFLQSDGLLLGRILLAMLRGCCCSEGMSAIGHTPESLMLLFFTKVAGSHSHRGSMRSMMLSVVSKGPRMLFVSMGLCWWLSRKPSAEVGISMILDVRTVVLEEMLIEVPG